MQATFKHTTRNRLFGHLLANGGFTAAFSGRELYHYSGPGYVVGGLGIAQVFKVDPNDMAGSAERFYRALRNVEAQSPKSIGAWLDSQTGLYWIEENRIFEGREEAIRFARANGQIALWDLLDQCEIRLI